ncbi:MAG: hypothetical protein ACYC75_03890, partial [Minisyncoccota bacterium]
MHRRSGGYRSALFTALIVFVSVLSIAPSAHASNPWPYAPGATTNPACLPADSTCVVTSPTVSGTIGQIPYYAAAGYPLSATSTLTLLSNGNFGIGTTTPVQPLSVAGKIYTTGGILFPDGSLQTAAALAGAVGSQGQIAFYNANGSTISGTSTVTILQNGNVGIGTSTPNANLALQGSAGQAGNLFNIASSTGTSVFSIDSNG